MGVSPILLYEPCPWPALQLFVSVFGYNDAFRFNGPFYFDDN